MGRYILSNLAKREIVDILHEGTKKWGEEHARAFVHKLFDTLELLGEMPHLGTLCKGVPGFRGATNTLRRYPFKPFVILYEDAPIILVARIGPARMRPGAIMRGLKKLTYN